MALELLKELDSGVDGNYWRIGSVVVSCTDDPIVTIYMELYINQAARQAGKSNLMVQPVNMMLYQIDSSFDYDFRACIYNSIKQLPYWENARDIFEFSEKYDISPIANYVDIECDYNASFPIVFNAEDLNDMSMTYTIISQPANGTVALQNGIWTYTPNADWAGTDVATYRASNGTNESNLAKIYITVESDAPSVSNMNLQADYNGSNVVNFTGTDPNNLPLTFDIVNQPANGSISENNGVWTYTPNVDWFGSDQATFRAYNGTYYSQPANITILVESDVPTANSFSGSLQMNTSLLLNLTGTDPNNLPLNVTIVTNPENGIIQEINGSFVYNPETDYIGPDSASFKVNNGNYDSSPASINLNIEVYAPQAYDTLESCVTNADVDLNISGNDPNNLPLTFNIVDQPENGSITETNGVFKYKPNLDFVGTDTATFKANNGFLDSNIANITIEVGN